MQCSQVDNVCLQNGGVEVTENENIQVKYKYLKNLFSYTST